MLLVKLLSFHTYVAKNRYALVKFDARYMSKAIEHMKKIHTWLKIKYLGTENIKYKL